MENYGKLLTNPGRSRNTAPGNIDLYFVTPSAFEGSSAAAEHRRQPMWNKSNILTYPLLCVPVSEPKKTPMAKLLYLFSCERDP